MDDLGSGKNLLSEIIWGSKTGKQTGLANGVLVAIDTTGRRPWKDTHALGNTIVSAFLDWMILGSKVHVMRVELDELCK